MLKYCYFMHVTIMYLNISSACTAPARHENVTTPLQSYSTTLGYVQISKYFVLPWLKDEFNKWSCVCVLHSDKQTEHINI